MSPTESFLKGMSATARGEFKLAQQEVGSSLAKVSGILEGVKDATRLIVKKGNLNAIGAPEELAQMHELAKQKMRPAISSENLGVQGKLGQFVDGMGSLIRIPGNALVEGDKAFKLINYRMSVSSQSYVKGSAAAGSSADKRMAMNALRNNPDEHMAARAIEEANFYTFTNELGDLGNKTHELIQKTPLIYMIPFFKTPTNIVKMGVRYGPWGNLVKDLKPALMGTGAERDAARAKIAMGTFIPGAMMMSLGDNISGRIDESTPAGRFKAEKGVPPYSIKVGDKWLSYEKLEPMRSILGLVVNYRDAIQSFESIDPATGEENPMVNELFAAIATPFIQTVGDNYMLSVIGHINYMIDGATSGNPEYFGKQMQKMAASATVPNFIRQFNSALVDTTFREADNYIEMVKQGIPGYSKSLPARRNLWGEEQHTLEGLGPDIISPIKSSYRDPDSLEEELIRLEVTLPKTPKALSFKGQEYDLSPQQGEQFAILRGQGVGDSPVSLKEILFTYLDDPGYTELPDDQKKEYYQFYINKATDLTKKFMIASDPQLQQAISERMEYLQLKNN